MTEMKELTTIQDRIKYIMEQKGVTQQEFAHTLGISPASLSGIFTGRTQPTNNHTHAIHRVFPEISVTWLLFGEGEMFIDGTCNSEFHIYSKEGAEETNTSPPIFEALTIDFKEAKSGEKNINVQKVKDKECDSNLPMESSSSTSEKAIPASRKIVEIRVFFDDNTYETFAP